ncbi:hypothetical protein C8A05DRAFT_37313 [Staphylotrichum tortipilum]|uniref:Uncharacterized protein n=1 Tax=Staphylotrichum tortipilum TaxID=2831512 RepID=A0AAN6RPX6_9PEZI|nr:hypothetical protein C8A05DRAFT_37313 [Staphylotrichum longicolle]
MLLASGYPWTGYLRCWAAGHRFVPILRSPAVVADERVEGSRPNRPRSSSRAPGTTYHYHAVSPAQPTTAPSEADSTISVSSSSSNQGSSSSPPKSPSTVSAAPRPDQNDLTRLKLERARQSLRAARRSHAEEEAARLHRQREVAFCSSTTAITTTSSKDRCRQLKRKRQPPRGAWTREQFVDDAAGRLTVHRRDGQRQRRRRRGEGSKAAGGGRLPVCSWAKVAVPAGSVVIAREAGVGGGRVVRPAVVLTDVEGGEWLLEDRVRYGDEGGPGEVREGKGVEMGGGCEKVGQVEERRKSEKAEQATMSGEPGKTAVWGKARKRANTL